MNPFVLRKKGTNNCITSDKNNNAILRDCDESILQRPNTTIFRSGTISNDGMPGNLQTIMNNPKNKNTNRDSYSGTLPYDQFIDDIKNDVLGISADITGERLSYKFGRANDPKQFALKDGRLTINTNGKEAKISADNVVTNKFKNNKFANDVVSTVNNSLSISPAAIGVSNNGKWQDFLNTVIYNNPVVKYIKDTIDTISLSDYTYNYPAGLALPYDAICRTTNDEFKSIFKKLRQNSINLASPFSYEYYFDGALTDVFPSIAGIDVTKNLIALIDTDPEPGTNFLQGLYQVTTNTTTTFYIQRQRNIPMIEDLKGIYVRITQGQFANDIYKFSIRNNTIYADKTEFKITSAKDDIYNYQADPQIGALYDRNLPVPIYKFANPVTGRFLKTPNPAPNETHPYYSKCYPNDKYCFNSCYGRPDTQCAIENPDLIYNNDINYFSKYTPELDAFDIRFNNTLDINAPFQKNPPYAGQNNNYKLADITPGVEDFKKKYDNNLMQTLQQLQTKLIEICTNYRNYLVFPTNGSITNSAAFTNPALEHLYVSFLLSQYEAAINGGYQLNFNSYTGPNFYYYKNLMNSFRINSSTYPYNIDLPTGSVDFIREFPALYAIISLINVIGALINEYYYKSTYSNRAFKMYEIKSIFDMFEKAKIITNNLNTEFAKIVNSINSGLYNPTTFLSQYPLTPSGFRIKYTSYYSFGSYLQPEQIITYLSQGRSSTDQSIYLNYMNGAATAYPQLKAILNSPKTQFSIDSLPIFTNEFPNN